MTIEINAVKSLKQFFLGSSSSFGGTAFSFVSFLQLLFLAYLVFVIYWRTKGTQVQIILKGIILMTPIVSMFYLFHLSIFTWLFELCLPALIVSLVVLFTPELRRFFANFGRDGFNFLSFSGLFKSQNREHEPRSTRELVKEVVEAVEIFSRNKTGALIVFDNTWSDRLYINSGRKLDAVVSTELLLNIFYPKSPLHDGAVLIRSSRIYAASVILPITENPKLNPWQYGTRHRAALGISETNPGCFCVIVSEETGGVSIAEGGKIIKIQSVDELPPLLEIKLLNLESSN